MLEDEFTAQMRFKWIKLFGEVSSEIVREDLRHALRSGRASRSGIAELARPTGIEPVSPP